VRPGDLVLCGRASGCTAASDVAPSSLRPADRAGCCLQPPARSSLYLPSALNLLANGLRHLPGMSGVDNVAGPTTSQPWSSPERLGFARSGVRRASSRSEGPRGQYVSPIVVSMRTQPAACVSQDPCSVAHQQPVPKKHRDRCQDPSRNGSIEYPHRVAYAVLGADYLAQSCSTSAYRFGHHRDTYRIG
jgi:hypothetical protein